MKESVLFLIPVALVAIVVLFFLLKKKTGLPLESHTSRDSDMILDRGQQRLHVAMREYLVDEMKSEDEWRTFDFIQGIHEGSKLGRAELEKRLAAEFKIDKREAGKRLTNVLKAVQTVKQKHSPTK